ncbi:MAG: hypothetical protein ACOYK9_01340 [Chlamydiia bacterium]
MGTHCFIPHLLSPFGEVISTDKNIHKIRFENVPIGFLGFQNPIDHFLLDPALHYRLLGAQFRMIQIEKRREKRELLLEIQSNIPLQIGKKGARIFIRDDRFLVTSKNLLEELKKEELLQLTGFEILSTAHRLQALGKEIEKNYQFPSLANSYSDFSDSTLTKLLVQDPRGLIHKFQPIKHETLFLVSDICLHPQGMHTPLLHESNSTTFDLYKESEYRQKISFFSPRGLKSSLDSSEVIQNVFSLSPTEEKRSALFLTSMNQLKEPLTENWISLSSSKIELPPVMRNNRHQDMLERFIDEQCETPILEAIQEKEISSEGALFVTYLPSFFLRGLFFDRHVRKKIKRIYFLNPSKKTPGYFSHGDRSFLLDLNAYGIEVFWFDRFSQKLLQFCERVRDYTGIFLPPQRIEEYHKALTIGIYGSSCVSKDIEPDIRTILLGLEAFKLQVDHPLLSPSKPLALSTGGGPGVMGIANKVAYDLGILSIAHLCNFSFEPMNPFLDGKMTYRIEKMIERQAEFLVKLPIFFIGGYGSDLELALEVVGRQVGSYEITPILLFGEPDYWEQKITSRFVLNSKTGTLRGTEFLSNCLIQVSSGEEALKVYKEFFSNNLTLGPTGRVYPKGFCTFKEIYDDV